ncbi:MAG: acyltransferase family protein [Terriglobales bacterium]
MLPAHAQDRVGALDGWRTISVAMVIACHIGLYSSLALRDDGSILMQKVMLPGLNILGGLGVNVFFVISGFVICRGLMQEFETFGRLSLAGFYLRRFLRIVPPSQST